MITATDAELRQLVFEASVAYANKLPYTQEAEWERQKYVDAFLASKVDPRFVTQIVCTMGHVSESTGNAPDGIVIAGICPCPKCGARADWIRTRPRIPTATRSEPPTPEKAA